MGDCRFSVDVVFPTKDRARAATLLDNLGVYHHPLPGPQSAGSWRRLYYTEEQNLQIAAAFKLAAIPCKIASFNGPETAWRRGG